MSSTYATRSTSEFNFRIMFTTARDSSSKIADATSEFSSVGAAGTRYFLTTDERSGYAIRPDGELVYVFSLEPGRGNSLVSSAIANGAERLDCFDGYLPRLYASHGFVVVERERNWNPGGPDVVYMRTVDGMLSDGWTPEAAFNHRDGYCDIAVCTADHTYDYAAS